MGILEMLPTPSVCGNYNRKGASPTSADGLATAVSKSSAAASPVRTSALQELEQAWMESDLDSFEKSCDSLANYDPDSSSWKTCQLSLFGGLTEFSWESLRWGTIVDGRLYQPARLEPRTSENDGSYLPTPQARDWKDGNFPGPHGRHSESLPVVLGGPPNPIWLEWLMGYKTGWTELSAWAMRWFRPKREKPSKG